MPNKKNLPKGIALKFTFWYLLTQQHTVPVGSPPVDLTGLT
jgi:hypothetical protein